MFLEGQRIGSYTLIRQLGSGGFGEVWLAERRTAIVTKKVAVKLPHEGQVNFDSIRQEAALWEQASGHPNVLPIIDADVYDGQVVIVSEYADGGSLAGKLKAEDKLSLKQAVEMTIGVLNGLEFLHHKKIIHRDIKPANILLQGDTPRLADFGISRAMQTDETSSTIVGTDAYMSPEAFDGKRNVQTDIWSVGVVLYQLLTGSLPFPQPHPTERMFAILHKEIPPLTDEIPSDLRRIVQKALAKLSENRYQSAKEMCENLEKILVSIKHPTFAPTEVLHKKDIDSAYDTNKKIVADNSTVTDVSPREISPTEPVIQNIPISTDQNNDASIVTEISVPKTEPLSKILPTAAVPFAGKTAKSRKKFAVSIGAVMLGLILLVGGFGMYKLSVYLTTKDIAITQRDSKLPSLANIKLIPYRKGKLWGFSDVNRKILIEPKYYSAQPFREDMAIVWLNGKSGFVDTTGREIIFNKYLTVGNFSEGLAVVEKHSGSWRYKGYINKDFQEIIPPKYALAYPFEGEVAKVRLNFDDALKVKSGFDEVLIDKTGQEVTPKYDAIGEFSEGLIWMSSRSGSYGYIDKTGKEIIPEKYGDCKSFSEGLAAVSLNSRWGIIDKTGQIVLPFKYDWAGEFSEGLIAVKLNDKFGFIDKTDNEIIPFKYDDAYRFSEGVAPVELNGMWGFIDKTGKVVIPFKYLLAFPFENGIATVKTQEPGRPDLVDYIGIDGTEYFEDE